jgi:predicted regulator of Ras-like GTPase activity (Roadblock/LC7/MglB family)
MSFTGEMLAYDSADPKIDLTLVGATFNDIFRSAHEASKKIGLEACRETTIATPKGVIVMRCSGTDAKVHFHLIGILAADGNQALMKMQIEKMVPAVMGELG